MNVSPRRRQAGITVIGFLCLAALIGAVALGGIKIFPLYYQNIRLGTVMNDVQRDLSGSGVTPQAIRLELEKRFAVEGVDVPDQNVKIAQSGDGYSLSISHEARAPYIANVWLLVDFEKEVQIRR